MFALCLLIACIHFNSTPAETVLGALVGLGAWYVSWALHLIAAYNTPHGVSFRGGALVLHSDLITAKVRAGGFFYVWWWWLWCSFLFV